MMYSTIVEIIVAIIDELRTIHWKSMTTQDPLPWNNKNFAYFPWPIDGFHYVKTKSQITICNRFFKE